MVNLLQLKTYAEHTNDTRSLYTINSYIKTTDESWSKGKYYLGGQLPLFTTENITEDHLKYVEEKNDSAGYAYNSWEQMSMQKSLYEFNLIKSLINSYTQKRRMNGLLRVIVFWLSPARKRAAEKVFHPSKINFNDI